MSAAVSLGPLRLGGGGPLFLIAGPCVIESRDHALMVAGEVDRLTRARGVPFVFKASYDKANRTSWHSFRAGQAQFIFPLARAAAGAGIDGLFVEVHEQPERALSDGPNALRLDLLGELLDEVLAIDAVVRRRTTALVP